MTRSSVQKSVCVICRAPLFGRLAVKMELVVRAWFLQADFSQTKLLEDAFKHLNSCPVQLDQTLEGLSVMRLIESWRHKALLLFKLLLLRRKVLMYGSPAGPLSAALLTLVSLLPRCLEHGLTRAANVTLSRPLSPVSNVDDKNKDDVDCNILISNDTYINGSNQSEELSPKETGNMLEEKDRVSRQSFDEALIGEIADRQDLGREKCHSVGEKYKSQKSITEAQQSPTMARDMSVDGLYNLTQQIDQTECGFPLSLFEDGYICLPYLSLQYLDLLSDSAVQGFIVGASNVLFKQKRQLFDVLVELNEMRIETADMMLRRQLVLGTEDLRFADHVVRHGATQGDAWIRDQFSSYLIYLLRTSLLPDGSREIDSYNAQFMSAFKATPAYQQWLKNTNNGDIEAFANLAPVHPFSGQLSVADMKLKFAHTMSTTEGGRKVTAAVASTGRAVATTSRAVGGALSQARGALSGWWTALTGPAPALTDPAPALTGPAPALNDLAPALTDPAPAGPAPDSPPGPALQADDALRVGRQVASDDNRNELLESPDPPDKSIEDAAATNISKIQVI
ncbi:late secretory pathway protein AVL9 homolog isoform X2 [Galleria mellonella]|nr:late secretory pathway protein AVL9 homolog isoform X2 [Galleria mellonella]